MEFTVGSNNFKSDKLNAFKQLHVSRKLSPVMVKLIPTMFAAAALEEKAEGDVSPEELASMMDSLQPLALAMADMSEADCEFVCATCLSVVSMQQANGAWFNVWNAGSKQPQFEEIDLSVMLQIVAKVVQEQLAPFFSELFAKTTQGS